MTILSVLVDFLLNVAMCLACKAAATVLGPTSRENMDVGGLRDDPRTDPIIGH